MPDKPTDAEKAKDKRQELREVLDSADEAHALLELLWQELGPYMKIEMKTLIRLHKYFDFDDSE